MEDHDISTLRSSDVIVLVMGLTGVGKSTFIEKITGENAGVGHSLLSATAGLGLYCFETNGRRVFFVDTPGFDDTRCSDTEIFGNIAHFLARVYISGARLGGILYLHRITDNRVSGSAARSFNLVKKMCGPKAARFTVLVTTMWDSTPSEGPRYEKAVERDNELTRTEAYWGSMLRLGSRAHRWTGTRASGLSILSGLLWQFDNTGGHIALKVQEEVVDEKRDLDETDAGMELAKHHGTRWQGFQKEISELRVSIERDIKGRGGESAALLQAQKRDLENRIKQSEVAEQILREGVDDLFEAKTMHYKALYQDTQREAYEVSRQVMEMRSGLELLWRQLQDEAMAFEAEVRQYQRARAAVAAGRRKLLDEAHREREARYERKRIEAKGQQELTEKEIAKKEKRRLLKRNSLAILGMLGGVAAIAAGAATMQIPVVAAGIGLFGTASMKLDFPKKKKEKDGDKEREVGDGRD